MTREPEGIAAQGYALVVELHSEICKQPKTRSARLFGLHLEIVAHIKTLTKERGALRVELADAKTTIARLEGALKATQACFMCAKQASGMMVFHAPSDVFKEVPVPICNQCIAHWTLNNTTPLATTTRQAAGMMNQRKEG